MYSIGDIIETTESKIRRTPNVIPIAEIIDVVFDVYDEVMYKIKYIKNNPWCGEYNSISDVWVMGYHKINFIQKNTLKFSFI